MSQSERNSECQQSGGGATEWVVGIIFSIIFILVLGMVIYAMYTTSQRYTTRYSTIDQAVKTGQSGTALALASPEIFGGIGFLSNLFGKKSA